MEKVEQLSQIMDNLGIPANAQIALLGNIHVETGGTYDYKAQQKGGKGYGLLQMDYHKKPYFDDLKANKLKDSPENQLSYFLDTIYGNKQDIIGRGNAAQLRKAIETEQDPAKLTGIMSDLWFKPGKPNMDQRLEAARMYTPTAQQAPVNTGLDELMGGFGYLKDMFNFGKP